MENQEQINPFANKAKIRELNDLLRTTFLPVFGEIIFTPGFRDLDKKIKEEILTKIREFKDFNEGNDPHGEHDFSAITHESKKIFWKIDYYDLEHTHLSPDASDPKITCRVLTIMLAAEY